MIKKISILLPLIFTFGIAAESQTTENASELLMRLPDSEAVMFVDAKRLFADALPLLTANTAKTTNHQQTKTDASKNVGETERIASGGGGGLLAAYGLYRMDLIGLGIAALGGAFVHRAATGQCQVYSALGVDTVKSGGAKSPSAHSNRVEKQIAVNKPLEEIFDYWRNFENLPKIMSHLESVTVIDHKRSHWKAKAPLGTSVEWDAEITGEQKNRLIAWRSVEGADVDNSGSVRFDRTASGGETAITVIINFTPPAGRCNRRRGCLLVRRKSGTAVGRRLEEIQADNGRRQSKSRLNRFTAARFFN